MGVEVALPTPREEEKKPGVFAVGDRVKLISKSCNHVSQTGEVVGARAGEPSLRVRFADGNDYQYRPHQLEHIPTVEKKSWHGFYEGERVKHKSAGGGLVTGGNSGYVSLTLDTGKKEWLASPRSLTRLSDEKPKEWHGFKEGEHVRGGMGGGDENRRNGIVCGNGIYSDSIKIRVDKDQNRGGEIWCCYVSNTERI